MLIGFGYVCIMCLVVKLKKNYKHTLYCIEVHNNSESGVTEVKKKSFLLVIYDISILYVFKFRYKAK